MMNFAYGAMGNLAFTNYLPMVTGNWGGIDLQCVPYEEYTAPLFIQYNALASYDNINNMNAYNASLFGNNVMQGNPYSINNIFQQQLNDKSTELHTKWDADDASNKILTSESTVNKYKTYLKNIAECTETTEEQKKKANDLTKKIEDLTTKINDAKKLTDSKAMLEKAKEIETEAKALDTEAQALIKEATETVEQAKKKAEEAGDDKSKDNDGKETGKQGATGNEDAAALHEQLVANGKKKVDNGGNDQNQNGNTPAVTSEEQAAKLKAEQEAKEKADAAAKKKADEAAKAKAVAAAKAKTDAKNKANELFHAVEDGNTEQIKKTINGLTKDNIIEVIDNYNNNTATKSDFITDVFNALSNSEVKEVSKHLASILYDRADKLNIVHTGYTDAKGERHRGFDDAYNDFKDESKDSWSNFNIDDEKYISTFNEMVEKIQKTEKAKKAK